MKEFAVKQQILSFYYLLFIKYTIGVGQDRPRRANEENIANAKNISQKRHF
ncbi:MAG: hypothetical protein IJN50_06945 [Clostridia bacterium]|nr:hypothetical protein [Clostridia bacterium]